MWVQVRRSRLGGWVIGARSPDLPGAVLSKVPNPSTQKDETQKGKNSVKSRCSRSFNFFFPLLNQKLVVSSIVDMAVSLKASERGLEIVDGARISKGWRKAGAEWYEAAKVAPASLKRFWQQQPIKQENFIAICQAVDVNWEEIAELPGAAKRETPMQEPESETDVRTKATNQNQQHVQPYMERPPIESQCYEAIEMPGALIRIKAPKQMGKTLLMGKIFEHATEQGYKTVSLNLLQPSLEVIQNLEKFLHWFCISVGRQLNLRFNLPFQVNEVKEYWEENQTFFSNNEICTDYFENRLLNQIDCLVLGLDNVDRLFSHQEVSEEFFIMLRVWYETARYSKTWQKLRLAIAHSTEDYGKLDINRSVFGNVGLAIELPEFTLEQVTDLVHQYGLSLKSSQIQKLIEMVGGHPYLVQTALFYLKNHSEPENEIKQILQLAPTETGLYNSHLQEHWEILQKNQNLLDGMRKVIKEDEPKLEPDIIFQLHSMGLIKLEGKTVKPRCDLYRQYFGERLESTTP